MRDVDAAADDDACGLASMHRLDEDAGDLGPADERVVRPFQGEPRARGAEQRAATASAAASAATKQSSARGAAPRARTRRQGGVQVAGRRGPHPAAPAASRQLLARRRPRADLEPARSLGIGRADLSDARAGTPRPWRALQAASVAGACSLRQRSRGSRQNERVGPPPMPDPGRRREEEEDVDGASRRRARREAQRHRLEAAAGSSKYMSLTMRR